MQELRLPYSLPSAFSLPRLPAERRRTVPVPRMARFPSSPPSTNGAPSPSSSAEAACRWPASSTPPTWTRTTMSRPRPTSPNCRRRESSSSTAPGTTHGPSKPRNPPNRKSSTRRRSVASRMAATRTSGSRRRCAKRSHRPSPGHTRAQGPTARPISTS